MDLLKRLFNIERRVADLYHKIKKLMEGGGVKSVSGLTVDNTDPLNPIINDSRPYKAYTALVSQSGTNPPTTIILENTLGTIPTSYSSTGVYRINVGSFNINKIGVSLAPNRVTTNREAWGVLYTGSYVEITNTMNGTPTNGILSRQLFEFRVYN